MRTWLRHASLIAIAAATLADGTTALAASIASAGPSAETAISAPEPTAFAPTYEETQKAARDRDLSVPGPISTTQPATALQPSECVVVNADSSALTTSSSSEFPALHVVIGGLIGAGIGLALGAFVFLGGRPRGHPVGT
jgi:hypothetical protein